MGIQYFKRIAGAHMGQGANGQIITTSNHVGTHMDGEIHFHASGRSIGQVPIEEWIGPGVVADISKEVGDYDLYSPEMLTKNVEIKKGDILIINTGYHRYAWDQRQSDELRYFVKHPGPGPGLPQMGAGHEVQVDRRGLRQRGPSHEHHHPQLAPRPFAEAEKKLKADYGKGWDEMFPQDEYYQVMHLKLFPKKLVHAENIGGEIEKLTNQRAWIGCFPLRGIELESPCAASWPCCRRSRRTGPIGQLNAPVLPGGQMEANELVRREGLRPEASRFQRGKVIVFRDHEIGRRRNGTVAELVVVWIGHHHTEAVPRLDLADVVVEPGQQLQQRHHLPPAFSTGELDGHLFVFEQDFRGESERQPAIQQSAQNGIKRLPPAKDLEEDAGVEADRHA